MNLYEQTKKYLVADNFKFQEKISKEDKFIFSKVDGENVRMNVFIHYIEDKNTILCFSELPLNISIDKRKTLLQFLSNLNQELLITNFLLSEQSGVIKLKSVLYQDNELTQETFRKFLFTNIATLDLYAPNIFKKIYDLNNLTTDKEKNNFSLN